MRKQKQGEINLDEKNGEKAIESLLKLTKEIKNFERKVNPIIEELEKEGFFT